MERVEEYPMDQEVQFIIEECMDEDGSQEPEIERILKVRLDKWLWAARFFKTRAIARVAVERGQVYYNGERTKPSREIEIGAILNIRLGNFEKTIEIKGLSTRRRSTEEAFRLFEETTASRLDREQTSFQRDLSPERRTVRFLRRSMVRVEPRQERVGSNNMKVLEFEMTD